MSVESVHSAPHSNQPESNNYGERRYVQIDNNPDIEYPNNDAHNLQNGAGYSQIPSPDQYAWSDESPDTTPVSEYGPDAERAVTVREQQAALDTLSQYGPLRSEVDLQLDHAIKHVGAENVRATFLNAGIKANERKVEELDKRIHKLESKSSRRKGKIADLEWKKLKHIHAIELASEAKDALPDKIEKGHGEEFQDMYKNPSFKSLKAAIRNVNVQVERRREILQKIDNPTTSEAARSLLKSEVTNWGDNFELGAYRDQLLKQAHKDHAERLANDNKEQEIELFESATKDIQDRITTFKEFNETSDQARRDELALIVAGWNGQSIADYRKELLGGNDMSVQRYKRWVAIGAQEKLTKVKQNPEEQDKLLKSLMKDEEELDKLREANKQLDQQPEQTDEIKAEIEANNKKIAELEKRKTEQNHSVQELIDKVVSEAEAEYNHTMLAVA